VTQTFVKLIFLVFVEDSWKGQYLFKKIMAIYSVKHGEDFSKSSPCFCKDIAMFFLNKHLSIDWVPGS
jgi:hypothetical protein